MSRVTPSKPRGCGAPGAPAPHTAAGSLLVLSQGWEATSLPGVLKEPRGGILGVSCVRSWT